MVIWPIELSDSPIGAIAPSQTQLIKRLRRLSITGKFTRLITSCLVVTSDSKKLRRRGKLTIKRDRKSGSAGMPRPKSYAVFCLKKKKIKQLPRRPLRHIILLRDVDRPDYALYLL